jgi:hypothetical protein
VGLHGTRPPARQGSCDQFLHVYTEIESAGTRTCYSHEAASSAPTGMRFALAL